MSKPILWIVIPCYNEQEVLEEFHTEVGKVFSAVPDCRFRFLFVNDGSRDGTLSIIRRLAEEDPRV